MPPSAGGGASSVEVLVLVPSGVGAAEESGRVYFLRMVAAVGGTGTGTGTGTVTHFSPRFALAGMTGARFSDEILRALDGGAVAGSAPPDPIRALIPPPPENAGGEGGGVSMGPDVPYPLQTGPVRYAPMQRQPGTAITAHPTPAGGGSGGWGFRKEDVRGLLPQGGGYFTRGGAQRPLVESTVTVEWGYTVVSLENMASPAGGP